MDVFCVCQIDNNTIKVDHLARLIQNWVTGLNGYYNWVIGNFDGVQPMNLALVIPIDVVGDWNFATIDILLLLWVMAKISKLHMLTIYLRTIFISFFTICVSMFNEICPVFD